MTVAKALRDLGEFLDECERSGNVTKIALANDFDADGEPPLKADLDVAFSLEQCGDPTSDLGIAETTVDSSGAVRLTFESIAGFVPMADHDVEVAVTEASVDPDGSVVLSLAVTTTVAEEALPNRDSASNGDEIPTGTTSATERDVPPFRDPELLQEVYESHDTFAEMSEAIGMDVTAETVRRYMIDHGIHEPDSYDTTDPSDSTSASNDATGTNEERRSDESPTQGQTQSDVKQTGTGNGAGRKHAQNIPLTDGIGLPEGVTVEALIETVERSNTLHEVKRDLDMERKEAHEMLKRLDMVDLVLGRLGTESDRNITQEDVIERLREASKAA